MTAWADDFSERCALMRKLKQQNDSAERASRGAGNPRGAGEILSSVHGTSRGDEGAPPDGFVSRMLRAGGRPTRTR